MTVRPDGPIPARIMIVGEAPGAEEEAQGIPFVGASGMELNRMLQEAGISRSECFVTNVVRERPPGNDINHFIAKAKKDITPKHTLLKGKWVTPEVMAGYNLLLNEIRQVHPKVILALGNTPLWALTGLSGITKWRGSTLDSDYGITIVPALHPAAVLREWSQRAITVRDFRRAARLRHSPLARPAWNFLIRPGYEQVIRVLDQLYIRANHAEPLILSFDLETRSRHIACAGVAWSTTDAICIPFMCVERAEGFWSEDQEAEIVSRLARLLKHPNVRVVGQNLLYDAQYTWRHWHFVPRVAQDTMISQHSVFSDLPKSLAFLASMYCQYYVYWKDEGKNWAPATGEDQLWHYNCEDCVYTYEVALALRDTVRSLHLEQVHDQQQAMFWPVLQAMQEGVRIDRGVRQRLIREVKVEVSRREGFLLDVLGHDLNPRSPKQMQALFYEDLKQPVQMTRAKRGEPSKPTLNDEALQKLALREPLIKPLINAIADIRTLGIFLSNFLLTPLDTDGRFRCAYNIGGSESGQSAPKTYRLSSSQNAFGNGGNLQVIPSSKSKSIGKAAARGGLPLLGDPYSFPNLREMFVPDPGYTWVEGDLDRADLHVVVYEANDAALKAAMKLGVDIHLFNAFILAGREPPPLDELVEAHSKYPDHRGPLKLQREFAKVFVHGTNYGGSSRTMAVHTGRTVAEVERAQRLWFYAHPGIKQWHDRVKLQVTKHRFIENKFSYKWFIFDRIDSIIPEAIAWIPQSTVSIVINKIWKAIYDNLPEVQVLAQVHDSLCMQVPTESISKILPQITQLAHITVPYEDPLVIPFTVKTSSASWGDC